MVEILGKRYDPDEIEKKWQKKWEQEELYKFNPDTDREVYSLDTPPPFTSGTLHMGHLYNHAWIDLVARYKRMRGYEVYFPQGFDCHGLPTELKVEQELDIDPENRELFLEKCRKWTEDAMENMKKQFRDIGYSTDWSLSYKTMDDSYKKLVQETLLQFYDQELLYRAKHPVLWCPECETALAKAEVGYLEEEGKLYHIDLGCEDKKLTIATTRPEMMPACVAVMVHPDDERYQKFHEKQAQLPLTGRKVPIIADEEVDMEFGTGVVYLCTFGDEQDMAWQQRYDLPVIEAIDSKGQMTEEAGKYEGLSTEEARAKIAEELIEKGVIRKIEDKEQSILAHTERGSCKTPIELLPMYQWFINIKDYLDDIVETAEHMNWHPQYMYQRLVDWAQAMDWDWIISRQRTFGTPVPFWVCECGEILTPEDLGLEMPVDPRGDERECPECGGTAVGSTDVCDCWVDSSVTPLVMSQWKKNQEIFERAYPASLRPQGYEIIRTWAFYTIYRCLMLTGEKSFENLLINGMVAGPDGKKMSKSLGNVIEPDEPLEKYSADTIRQWAAGGTQGEDYPFSWEECDHSQKFLTKLWNVSRFIQMHIEEYEPEPEEIELKPVDKWMLSKLQKLTLDCTENLDNYVFNETIISIRKYIWHQLADNYLEMVKHRLYKDDIYGKESKEAAQYTLYVTLETLLRLLSPFTPHVCEEIYSNLFGGHASIQNWPHSREEYFNEEAEEIGDLAVDVISEIRKYKSDHEMSLGESLPEVTVVLEKGLKDKFEEIREDIQATGKIENLMAAEDQEVDYFDLKVVE